jgi:hypothetical protein
MRRPLASTQAMASCAAVTPFSAASCFNVSTTFWFCPEFSPLNRGRCARKSPCPAGSEPLSNPRDRTPYAVTPMPVSSSSGKILASGPRLMIAYSICRSLIGATACALRIVSAPTSDSPAPHVAGPDEIGDRSNRVLLFVYQVPHCPRLLNCRSGLMPPPLLDHADRSRRREGPRRNHHHGNSRQVRARRQARWRSSPSRYVRDRSSHARRCAIATAWHRPTSARLEDAALESTRSGGSR